MEKKLLSDELLESINGGVLPEGWQDLADSLYPIYKQQYPNITYEEACAILAQYITDPDDLALVVEYIKKYFK